MYTSHGHWCPPGEPDDQPRRVARCGGPAICAVCAVEAQAAARSASPEAVARSFHEAYERLAPTFGYETRRESAVPWDSVPEQNRKLMTAVVEDLLRQGIIRSDAAPSAP